MSAAAPPKPAAPPMTAEEFADFVLRPENAECRFELVAGEAVEMPQAGKRHGMVCNRVAFLLTLHADKAGIGQVATNDSGVITRRDPDSVRGPDVVYWHESQPYADIETKWPERPPYLCVEVLSPSERALPAARKVQEYLNGGVSLVWQVDPEDRTVAVHRRGAETEFKQPGDELVGDGPLAGLRLKVEDLFAFPGA